MYREVSCVASEASRRLHIVLQLRRYYNVPAIFRLYKAHVLPFIERSTPAIFHACSSILRLLDNVQSNCLDVVQSSSKDVLLQFNLAPLHCRRHIGMLGLIHKTQLGLAPSCLSQFFPKASSTLYKFSVGCRPVHDRQVACHASSSCPVIFKRSVFALVQVYNKLPAEAVEAVSVSIFQRRLQEMLKTSAKGNMQNWHDLFNIV